MSIEILIFEALIDSCIFHDKFVSVNNVLREYSVLKKKKKSWDFCVIYNINTVDISRKTYRRNGIERIVDNDRILWLNEKHIEQRSDHKDLREIYNTDMNKIMNQGNNTTEFL